MKFVWNAIVRCKDRKYPMCGPIFLPYPNLPKTSAHRPNWPMDGWQAYVACHVCGGIALFEKADVEWGQVPQQLDMEQRTQNPFHRVSLRCDQSNCESLIEVLTMWPRGDNEQNLARRLGGASDVPKCANGHPAARPTVFAKTQVIGDL